MVNLNGVMVIILFVSFVSAVISAWQTNDIKILTRNSELNLEAYNSLSKSITDIEKNHADLLTAYVEESVKLNEEIEILKKKGFRQKARKPLVLLAPRVGFEPTTYGLTVRRGGATRTALSSTERASRGRA